MGYPPSAGWRISCLGRVPLFPREQIWSQASCIPKVQQHCCNHQIRRRSRLEGSVLDSRLVLPINTVVDGSYRIMRVVGSGGFGITYEAEDINLGTMVAVKEYYPEEFGDPTHDECASEVGPPQANV